MAERIDGVITFTLVRFMYTIAVNFVSELELAVLALWVTMLTVGLAGLQTRARWSPVVGELADLTRKLFILLLNQSIISISTKRLASQHRQILLPFVELSCLLMGAVALSTLLQQPSYTDRAITLLLYMYTDASQEILQSTGLGVASAVLIATVYIGLNSRLTEARGMHAAIFMRAFNMVSINVVLSVITDLNSATSLYTQSMLLIAFLFSVDVLTQLNPMFVESRDYCLWRSAQNLQELYKQQGVDPALTAVISCVLLGVKSVWHVTPHRQSISTLVELGSLILVNILLDVMASDIFDAPRVDKVLTLAIYVIFVHHMSSLVLGVVARRR